MNSERIKTIAGLINKNDIVLDVGCDHGYLSLYLRLNNLCQEVYASDISANALNSAIKNFAKYNLKIKTFVSNGFADITVNFNTAVIAGMGTSTILNILNHPKRPPKLILASNNEHYKLRKALNKMGYKLVLEKVVFEHNHYYIIMEYLQGKQKLKRKYLQYGISNDKHYFKYLLTKNEELMTKVPIRKKIEILLENLVLKSLIEKKSDHEDC